jgi:hypothetical protein
VTTSTRITLRFLRVLCVLGLLCGGSFGLDRNAFTFTNYDLEVRLMPGSNGFDARGKITLRNDSDQPQRAIALQISSSLTWHSVRFAGKPLVLTTSQYTSDIDHTGALSEGVVTLPHDVVPNGTVDLEVAYGGTIAQDAKRLTRIGAPENIATATEWDRISPAFTAFRGFGYVTWYPVSTDAASLSEGNRVPTTIGTWQTRHAGSRLVAHLECTCELTLVTNGHKIAPAPSQAEEREKVDVEFQAVGMAVPVIAAGNYQKLNRPEAIAYYLPEGRAKAEQFALAVQQVTPFVSEWVGAPHSPALLIDVHGSTTFDTGSTWIAPLSEVSPEAMPVTAVVLVARAAIMSPHRWIAEGLPEFVRVAYGESRGGRGPALSAIKNFRALLADAEKQPERNDPLSRATDPSFYRVKAMYVWWMLRDMVGDEPLKKAIHAYRATDDREPGYFQRLLRQFSRRDLEWFFDDWVYRDRGLPDFRIDSAFARPLLNASGKPQGATVTVTLENLGDAGAEIPVIARSEAGEVAQRVEVHSKSKVIMRIQVPDTIEEVIVSDGSVPESDVTNNTFKLPSK